MANREDRHVELLGERPDRPEHPADVLVAMGVDGAGHHRDERIEYDKRRTDPRTRATQPDEPVRVERRGLVGPGGEAARQVGPGGVEPRPDRVCEAVLGGDDDHARR